MMVGIGDKIISEGILFEVIRKHNEFACMLKSETGEFVNVFYLLSNEWRKVQR